MEEESHAVLRKWNSCVDCLHVPEHLKESQIRRFHIYDFDNTLYHTPHPNKQLLTKRALSTLLHSDMLGNGGWWSEPLFLQQSFRDSLEDGSLYWNNDVETLAHLSYADRHTVSIVLTGRIDGKFASLVGQMLSSRKGLLFNAVCLKPSGYRGTTADFKIELIKEFLDYYTSLEEVTIYDDREGQLRQFTRFSQEYTSRSVRWFIVPVPPRHTFLSVQNEIAIVQNIVAESSGHYYIKWMPERVGYFLSLAAHRELVAWTIHYTTARHHLFLLNLPKYPSYIPCRRTQEEEDTCVFLVTAIGFKTMASSSSGGAPSWRRHQLLPTRNNNRNKKNSMQRCQVFYKVRPQKNGGTAWPTELAICGSSSSSKDTGLIHDKDIVWEAVHTAGRRPSSTLVTTTFDRHAQLDVVRS